MKTPQNYAVSNAPTVLQNYLDNGRAFVDTATAARALGLKAQTLRKWACMQTWPFGLKSRKVNRRLLWSVEELIKILEVSV